jgi:hypothetical protein
MDPRFGPLMEAADTGLSAIDLKSKLIESLKTTGVVDEMKVRLGELLFEPSFQVWEAMLAAVRVSLEYSSI